MQAALWCLLAAWARACLGDCGAHGSCDECVSRAGCLWNVKPQHEGSRCFLSKTNVTEDFIVGYSNLTVRNKTNNDFSSETSNIVQIRPQLIQIKDARPGARAHFQFEYKPANNYPLDVYYLVDFSFSMKKFINIMREQGRKIYMELSNMTKNVRIGFGTFVEKPGFPFSVWPYIDTSFTNRRYLNKVDASNFNLTAILPESEMKGNLDDPEACLEALLQVIVCNETIGWRNESTKLILVTTDQGYHLAGDGRSMGAFRPQEPVCVMKNNKIPKERSQKYDYPSVHVISDAATRNHISVIFVVNNTVKFLYDDLVKFGIRNSKVVELKESEEDVVNLVKEEVNKLQHSFQFKSTIPRGLKVTYEPDCEVAPCSFKHGDTVKINATLSVEDCATVGATDHLSLVISGNTVSDKVEVVVRVVCDCEQARHKFLVERNSWQCSGSGAWDLGVCRCNKGWYGDKCEDNWDRRSPACYSPGDKRVCSGHGACVESECKCEHGYGGEHCECRSDDTCVHPFTDQKCSGETAGSCTCGACHCSEGRFGTYCEQCSNCTLLDHYCKRLHPCVTCQASDCRDKCTVRNVVAVVDGVTTEQYAGLGAAAAWVECKTLDTTFGCVRLFKYKTEGGELRVGVRNEDYCPQTSFIVMVSSTAGGLLLLGLASLLAWRGAVELHDRREYASFRRELQAALWTAPDNPLFSPATTTHHNPMCD